MARELEPAENSAKIDTANQYKRLNWKGKLKTKIKNKNKI
jgi:hypothetical protein